VSDLWTGEFGDDYADRNPLSFDETNRRVGMWGRIFSAMQWPARFEKTVLEIGAGSGNNLAALQQLDFSATNLSAVEPNDKARSFLSAVLPQENIFDDLSEVPGKFDLVFTSGVLIHIPPDDLAAFVERMCEKSARYVVAVEYFSKEPREVKYRGQEGALWTRDFGSFIADYQLLEPIACGFEWSRLTGLDDLTWWAFRV
jgi:pseudaminic acid biosynthesis-associated methylase